MLTAIANKVEQSKIHWTDLAKQIGIDKNDIFKIKRKNDSTSEFVHSVTQKIWDEIFHFVGLNLTDNDFTEISSIAKLAAILIGNIEKDIHQNKRGKAKGTNDSVENTNIKNEKSQNQTNGTTNNNICENIQVTNIENEKTENPTKATNNNASENIQVTNIENKTFENPTKVIHEITKRISQWRVFGRILNLQESYLNQLQTDCSLISERNHKIIQKFSMPLTPHSSWMFWRQYLDGFDDGKLVIEEMEGTFIDLLPQIPNTVAHIVTSDQLTYVGHPFQYSGNRDLTLDKENQLICVRVGSKEYQFAHYQEFSEFIETQKHYYDTYNMLKDLKAINFVDDDMCPILQTLKHYLDATNDSGFVMKGYNFVNHFCLFKQGVFAKDVFNDSYVCFLANDNVVLYLTKCSRGVCHALHHSLRNVQIANVLHSELQSNKITQINIIIHDETNDSTQICKQCMTNDLFVNEANFTGTKKFTLWYNKIIAKKNIQNKINQVKELSITGNEICNIIKKDMITYQALETSNLPSFSSCPEDQMDELKKLVVLSPGQFKAVHSDKKHVLLRGSYGSGKSLVLFKKLEQIVNSMTDSEILYFICNDQQSEFIQSMKILKSNYHMKNIIICRSEELTAGTKIIPKLSFILSHIKHVWKDKTVHILIDEFNGSYVTNSEIDKLKNLLHTFQSSNIIISLQSMEQNIMEIENYKHFSDFGYQYNKLTNLSFTLFNLDYSLRNSSEINEFVKVTAEILESSKVPVVEELTFSDDLRIVDSEHGLESSKKDLDKEAVIITAAYKYNQSELIGHAVKTGLVNIYHCSSKDLDETKERFTVYLSTLEYILKDLSEDNKYVICTYEKPVYNVIHKFLETSLLQWTINIKEFMKTNSKYTVLLTDYAAIRGYEYSNFIFLSPLGKRFLKYRMLECFTRCTTRLHIISDEMNVTSDSVDHQLIMKWKELKCVNFIDCSYKKSANKVFLVHNETEINCKENATEIYRKPSLQVSWYPWHRASKVNVDVSNVQDDMRIGLRCVVSMDNVLLFNDFIKLHNIDIFTFRDLLHIASEYDAIGISQILINDYKIDVNSGDKYKNTPLHSAAWYGSSNVVDILIKNGADVHVNDEIGETPLHKSLNEGHLNIVQKLLDNRADVSVKNEYGDTPLHKSSREGHINIVQLLLDNEADVNVKNKQYETPLHISSSKGHTNIVQVLLDNGAAVNVKNKQYETPLHNSSREGHASIVQLLLDNGADINVVNISHDTPLHKSSREGHINIVQLLLDNAAYINVSNRQDETPLHVSSFKGYINIVQLLLDNGANVNENFYGRTAIHLAKQRKHHEIVELLERYK